MIRRLVTTAAAALAASVLVACNSGSATPTPFTPSPAPSTSSTPSADPGQSAAAAAQAAYRGYIAAKLATAVSGGNDTSGLSKVATGIMLKTELNQAATFRGRKWRGVGQIDVIWTKTLSVGPVAANGQIAEVTVQACVDGSKVTTVDAKGSNVKKPGTPTRWIDEMQMRLDHGAWKAYYGMNKAAQCR